MNYFSLKLQNFFFSFQMKKETHSRHDTRASRSIYSIHFYNLLMYYMIKIIYFLRNILMRKNNHRLYLSKWFCISTLILYLTYFGWKMEFLIFNYSPYCQIRGRYWHMYWHNTGMITLCQYSIASTHQYGSYMGMSLLARQYLDSTGNQY